MRGARGEIVPTASLSTLEDVLGAIERVGPVAVELDALKYVFDFIFDIPTTGLVELML